MLHFLSIVIVMFGLSSAQTSEPLHYVLTDIEKNINQESFEIKSQDSTPDCPHFWSISKYVLHGGKQEGVEIIKIDNGRLRFDLVPTRGMSIMQVSIDDFYLGHKFVDSQSQNQPKEAADWLVRSGLNLSVTPASFIEVIVEREKPAHTVGGVKALQPWIYLDMHTYLGINTILTEPVFILGESSVISRDTALSDPEESGQIDLRSRLAMDTILT